ncbi:MAG TPA: hypothetical protein VNF24_01010 [Candidatus Acidoferrales bacterium]|nr:hypothetical protein [Candidatus Acidoferrales bacterium]
MGNTGWPGVFRTAAAAALVGGALLLANQLTPISGWTCIVVGLGLLAIGVVLDRPPLTNRFADVSGRVFNSVRERARKTSAAEVPTIRGDVRRTRAFRRCRGSTDGHHRWSQDPGVCMFCGEEIPEDRR